MASNLAKVEHVIYNFTLFPLKSECGYVGLILNEITMNVHPLILQFSYNLQGLTTPIQGANAILSTVSFFHVLECSFHMGCKWSWRMREWQYLRGKQSLCARIECPLWYLQHSKGNPKAYVPWQ